MNEEAAVVTNQISITFGDAKFIPRIIELQIIKALQVNGHKVLAVKYLRDLKGFSLREAKFIVEACEFVQVDYECMSY